MTAPCAAAIYARISLDKEGLGKGVDRQIADCQALADQLGWTVADVYTDNDVSAYSGTVRPEYQRMVSDIEEGVVDSILVYNLDRLVRQPREFEHFYDVATRAGIRDVRFATGEIEFGTDDGLFIGRILAAVAANESATKGRRLRRKNDELAAAGIPYRGGGRRPYGFKADRVTHEPAEARVIRRLAARYLQGERPYSLTMWLNRRGVPTVTGATWKSTTVFHIISGPKTAGLRIHRGQIVGPGLWKPILKPEVRDRILALHQSRKLSGRRTPRRYVLSGQLRCGLCGRTMCAHLVTQSRKSGVIQYGRSYACVQGPDHDGCCGRIAVTAPPVEELVVDAVLSKLDTSELADEMRARDEADEDAAELLLSIDSDRGQLEELARLFGDKIITAPEWIAARDQVETRLRNLQRRLEHQGSYRDLRSLIGRGSKLRSKWAGLDIGRQSAIVRAVVDHVVVSPGKRGAHPFDPSRIAIIWSM